MSRSDLYNDGISIMTGSTSDEDEKPGVLVLGRVKISNGSVLGPYSSVNSVTAGNVLPKNHTVGVVWEGVLPALSSHTAFRTDSNPKGSREVNDKKNVEQTVWTPPVRGWVQVLGFLVFILLHSLALIPGMALFYWMYINQVYVYYYALYHFCWVWIFGIPLALLVVLYKRTVIGTFKPGKTTQALDEKRWILQGLLQSCLLQTFIFCGASSPIISAFYRALGAKIGWNSQVMPFFATEFDMITVGESTSFGGQVSIFCRDHKGDMRPCKIGNDSAVTNSAIMLAGSSVGDGGLVGDLTLLQNDIHVNEGDRCVGSPPVIFPGSRAVPKKNVAHSNWIMFLHTMGSILLEITSQPSWLAITYGLFQSSWVAAFSGGPGFIYGYGGFALIVFLMMLIMMAMMLLVAIFFKRITTSFVGNSPRDCWTFVQFIWMTKVIVSLDRFLLRIMGGTPWIAAFHRAMGIDVSLKAIMLNRHTADVDLLTVGDHAIIGFDSYLELHQKTISELSFEPIVIGNKSVVGSRSILLRGSEVEHSAQLLNLSMVLPGEPVLSRSVWGGLPSRAYYTPSVTDQVRLRASVAMAPIAAHLQRNSFRVSRGSSSSVGSMRSYDDDASSVQRRKNGFFSGGATVHSQGTRGSKSRRSSSTSLHSMSSTARVANAHVALQDRLLKHQKRLSVQQPPQRRNSRQSECSVGSSANSGGNNSRSLRGRPSNIMSSAGANGMVQVAIDDADISEDVDVSMVVVGAGNMGLMAAYEFLQADETVLVLEKTDAPGGCWRTEMGANPTSHVAVTEPAYRFPLPDNTDQTLTAATAPTSTGAKEHAFNPPSYPSDYTPQTELLKHAWTFIREQNLEENIKYNSQVIDIQHVSSEPPRVRVSYRNSETRQVTTVTAFGVYIAIGAQQEAREVTWDGEEEFLKVPGTSVGYGIKGDVDAANSFRGKKVVIVGNGAFAVENVRTALMHGATHVTMVFRRSFQTWPRVVHYLASLGGMSFGELGKHYDQWKEWAGMSTEALGKDGMDIFMSQNCYSQPSASDFVFAAHKAGLLTIVKDEVEKCVANVGADKGGGPGVILKNSNQAIPCEVFLKCIGWKMPALQRIMPNFQKRQWCFLNESPNVVFVCDPHYQVDHLNSSDTGMSKYAAAGIQSPRKRKLAPGVEAARHAHMMEIVPKGGTFSNIVLARATARMQLFMMTKQAAFNSALLQLPSSSSPMCSWFEQRWDFQDINELNSLFDEVLEEYKDYMKERFPDVAAFVSMASKRYANDLGRTMLEKNLWEDGGKLKYPLTVQEGTAVY